MHHGLAFQTIQCNVVCMHEKSISNEMFVAIEYGLKHIEVLESILTAKCVLSIKYLAFQRNS